MSFDDFSLLIENYGVLLPVRDIKYLVSRFDVNGDLRVSYSEFILQLMPRSSK